MVFFGFIFIANIYGLQFHVTCDKRPAYDILPVFIKRV